MPFELKENYSYDCIVLTSGKDEKKLTDALESLGCDYTQNTNRFTVRLPDTMSALPVIDSCREYITSFEVFTGTMDDAFINITGKEMR